MNSFVITVDPSVDNFWGWIIPAVMISASAILLVRWKQVPKTDLEQREAWGTGAAVLIFFTIFSFFPVGATYSQVYSDTRQEAIEDAVRDLGYSQVFQDGEAYTLINEGHSETYLTVREGNTIIFHQIAD